jgi:hypothetical protein
MIMSRVRRSLAILLTGCYLAAGVVALAHTHPVAGGHDQHCTTCRLPGALVAVLPAPPVLANPDLTWQRPREQEPRPAQAARQLARGRSPPSPRV